MAIHCSSEVIVHTRHAFTHAHTQHTHTHVHTCTHTHTCTHMYTHTHICACICTCVCVCTCIYMCIALYGYYIIYIYKPAAAAAASILSVQLKFEKRASHTFFLCMGEDVDLEREHRGIHQMLLRQLLTSACQSQKHLRAYDIHTHVYTYELRESFRMRTCTYIYVCIHMRMHVGQLQLRNGKAAACACRCIYSSRVQHFIICIYSTRISLTYDIYINLRIYNYIL